MMPEQAAAPDAGGWGLETEQQLLGCLLHKPDAMEVVGDMVRPEMFQEPVHREIYEAIRDSLAQGRNPTLMTIAPLFRDHPALADLGGGQKYLVSLYGAVTSLVSVEDYAHAVAEIWRKRELIALGQEIAERCRPQGLVDDTRRIIAEIEDRMHSLLGGAGRRQTGFTIGEATGRLLVELEQASSDPQGASGITTGLADLDRRTGGIRPGHLWIMGGRPGMGKSAVACNVAYAAAKAGHGVLVISLEMPVDEVTGRMISIAACGGMTAIPYENIVQRRLTGAQLARVAEIRPRIDALPLFIDDEGSRSVASARLLIGRVQRLFERAGIKLGLVIIDYLQLMRGSATGPRDRNRVQELTEITTGLKAAAKEFEVGILALSQLSRAVEQREDKRPQLSDLRESGSIEQDADVVLFPYRHHYYLSMEKEPSDPVKAAEYHDRLAGYERKIEFIVAKNRHGKRCAVDAEYDAPHGRVSDKIFV